MFRQNSNPQVPFTSRKGNDRNTQLSEEPSAHRCVRWAWCVTNISQRPWFAVANQRFQINRSDHVAVGSALTHSDHGHISSPELGRCCFFKRFSVRLLWVRDLHSYLLRWIAPQFEERWQPKETWALMLHCAHFAEFTNSESNTNPCFWVQPSITISFRILLASD